MLHGLWGVPPLKPGASISQASSTAASWAGRMRAPAGASKREVSWMSPPWSASSRSERSKAGPLRSHEVRRATAAARLLRLLGPSGWCTVNWDGTAVTAPRRGVTAIDRFLDTIKTKARHWLALGT
ncbi:hypothetical protein GCM10018783_01120 [Streptomyces griseosporeus]|nr:hypothetical protein GCM10018783_01120 [Streptomyces griseosporeus]